MKYIVLAYLVVVVLMSIVSFVAYGFDKRRSQTNGRRVPEQTLHVMALLGGWPGALMGQRTFRHKTQKRSFRVVFWLCVALNLIVVSGAVYLWIGRQ